MTECAYYMGFTVLELPLQEVTQLKTEELPLESKNRIAYRVAHLADGRPLTLPVLVAVGRSRNPRLVCVAGVHGDEHEGVSALLSSWEEVEPAKIQGTLVFVPVANPPAFAAKARCNPQDPVDMNRSFPGREMGTVTERLAFHLFHGVVAGADLVLSMHGWSTGALVQPYVEYPHTSPVAEVSHAAARAFGLDTLEGLDWHPGLLCAVCNQARIAAIEPEIGGLGCTVPERRKLYMRGLDNLMKHLGMLPGVPERARTIRYVVRHEVVAQVGGVVQRHIELGAKVGAGDPIATITDLTGFPLLRIPSPASGTVAMLRLTASVNPGELLAIVFAPAV